MPRDSISIYYIGRDKSIGSDEGGTSLPHLTVDRKALTVEARHRQCQYEVPEAAGIKERLKSGLKKSCSCSAEKVKKFVYGKLPILSWLIGYDFKNWFVPDCIAGITVAILQIPQGMGFALLAQIPAICGIYMAFYQGLIYVFLGTCRQNSMGSFAVITLMTGKVVKELATFSTNGTTTGTMSGNTTGEHSFSGVDDVTSTMMMMMDSEVTYTPIQIATIVCFMVGIWHMLFGFLQLGTLSVFLSDMLVSGFTTAAAVHVLTSQVKDLLGLTIKGASGPLKIIRVYIEIFKSLHLVNILTIVISVVAITVLFINNEVLKPIVAKYSKVPIPIELIVVVIGTTASYFANLTETYDVNIIGDVPVGFPPAEVPPMELMGRVLVDSFVIAVVSFTITFSLAKIFSVKHNYPVDATQELYASGIGNLVSSFFACAPTSASLSRALVQDAAGGVTQMATLIVCILIVLVLLFIGPVFKTLPKAVLASIIVVALKGMFMQFRDMIAMWKISKIEAITWLITFFSTVIIDIDYGLLVGVIFSIFVLLTKNQRPTCFVLGRLANTDIYLDLKAYPQVKEISGMKLFKIVGPIHFANRENLRRFIVKGTGLDPKELQKETDKQTEFEFAKEKIFMHAIKNGSYSFQDQETKYRILIIDCSGVSYIDSAGGKFLEQLWGDYDKANISLCLAGLPENVYEIMSKSGSLKTFPSEHLFHSIHDAVIILKQAKDPFKTKL